MNGKDLELDERVIRMETTEELLSRLQERNPVRGVNVCGYLRTESGVGEAARRYIHALRAASVPVALRDLSSISGNRAQDETLGIGEEQTWFDVNLVCVDIDLHYAALYQLGQQFFEERYNIALWWWEQPAFPQKWADRFAYYDEVWAGSTFIANTLAPVSPIPIVHMPLPFGETTLGSRKRGRRRLGLAADTFTYLFIFDFHSHVERKNPQALIAAFKRAFAASDNVQLVIKCVNGASNAKAMAELQAQAEGYPIAIYEGYWPAEEMRDLVAACDAYVSLHRSEGAGLPIADAMAAGKPVIATGWSGNMAFMNVSNSYPVRYNMVELDKNVGPYRAGELWAEPSVKHAAELMRQVFENREQGRRRGQAAWQTMEREYSAERCGGLIAQRFQAVALKRQRPEFRKAVQERYRTYQQLPMRIREFAERLLPPDATIAVVSKGDDELLELNGRTAWHYPQDETGQYRGYYPADSGEAIEHLQALQANGAEFLLLPCSSYWWLEQYAEFGHYLHSTCAEIWSDESCIIYRLSPPGADRRLNGAQHRSAIEIEELMVMEKAVRQKVQALEARLAEAATIRRRFAREAGNQKQRTTNGSSLRRPHVGSPRNGQQVHREAQAPARTAGSTSAQAPVAEDGDRRLAGSSPLRKRLTYPQTIAHIQETVRMLVPPQATVLVVSKGDDRLLELDRRAWHFPRQEDGLYAGYYPATGRDAVEHLQALQAEGAEFLLFPNTAFWWLDHYASLQEYLVSTALWIHKDEWCLIYRLPKDAHGEDAPSSLWRNLTGPLRRGRQ